MLTKEISEVLKELYKITDLFEVDLKEFLNKFNDEDFFTFGDSETKRKKALSLYSSFSIKLNNYVNLYENSVVLLSHHICKADQMCDLESTKKLSYEFERYTQLFTSIKKFTTDCDAALQQKDNSFKQSVITTEARELLSSITHYKNNFETC